MLLISKTEEFQKRINESLDSAIENGYELDEWSAEDIAADLNQYDSNFESFESKDLVPFIQTWKDGRK